MSGLIGRVWSTLIRVVLLLFGLAMFFGVMVFGAVVAVCITAWALIRGRRMVPMDFGWKGPVDWRSGARRQAAQRSADAEVVDIDARVIERPAAAPQQDKDRQPD